MKFFAKLFIKLNQSLFSFFSGIFVSLSLNIFTSILMDSSICFSILNILAVIMILVGSGVLIHESVLLQNYIETITNAKKIRMSIEEICSSPKVRKMVVRLIVYFIISVAMIATGLFSLYCDFNKLVPLCNYRRY